MDTEVDNKNNFEALGTTLNPFVLLISDIDF